jgi:DNA-directed RNA polymerase subunit alpha
MIIDLELSDVKVKEIAPNHEVLTITPLPTGYGTTIGTALRRVLLSSLSGYAITAIKIAGITHEFTTIPGVKDSVVDMILNLKQVRFLIADGDSINAKLSVNKEGKVFAKDIKLPGDMEIANPDLLITTLDKKTKLEIDFVIEKGCGFSPVVNRENRKNKEINLIEIDAFFCPVKKVSFNISKARVGQSTDLDKLELEIETDGTINPKDALSKSAGILRNYFGLLDPEYLTTEERKTIKNEEEENIEEEETILGNKSGRKYTPVEVLKLSPRTLNALINNKIDSVEQLITYTENKLTNLKGFGAKAMFEVKEALKIIDQKLNQETE